MNASAHLVTLFDVGSHAPRGSSSESRHVIHVHVRLSLSSPLSSSTLICPSRPKLRDLSADQNYKGSLQKTNWRSRTSCRKFGDLIAADHKVLSENCESRNNHRHAVVVQDLATQWIQSYPCETKTSQEIQRSLQKFLEPDGKPKVIYTENSLECGKACEDLSWNHCTSTPHRSETNGIAERAVRRIKEGTPAALSQSGLDEKMVGGFHGMLLLYARNS